MGALKMILKRGFEKYIFNKLFLSRFKREIYFFKPLSDPQILHPVASPESYPPNHRSPNHILF